MSKRISLSEMAHQQIRPCLSEGAVAIDATLGNGHDTLFLAQGVGDSGHVYGFDIQLQAIDSTRLRLEQHDMQARATLFLASHADMAQYVPAALHRKIQAIMFNLGYLPGADKSIITQADTSLRALDVASLLLAGQGVMTVMVYPGHSGGDVEAAAVEQWAQRLDTARYGHQVLFGHHHQANAPRLFVIRKLS